MVLFAGAAYIIPSGGQSNEVQLILTVSTFLFAIIVGFYLSRLNGRYDKMRELIAAEDAGWLSAYEQSVFLGSDFQAKVGDVIDKYYISAYDFKLGTHKGYTEAYMQEIYKLMSEAKNVEGFKAENAFDHITAIMEDIEKQRNEVTVVTLEKLTKGQWGIIFILAGIILFGMFFLRGEAFYSGVIVVLLSTVLALILLVMRDLQNFFLGGTSVVEESGQQVFETIGKLRYYPDLYLRQHPVDLPPHVSKYRVGYHEAGQPHKIELRELSK